MLGNLCFHFTVVVKSTIFKILITSLFWLYSSTSFDNKLNFPLFFNAHVVSSISQDLLVYLKTQDIQIFTFFLSLQKLKIADSLFCCLKENVSF